MIGSPSYTYLYHVAAPPCPDFYVGPRDPNLVPNAYTAGTLPTELSPASASSLTQILYPRMDSAHCEAQAGLELKAVLLPQPPEV